jgi:hypothetical protein
MRTPRIFTQPRNVHRFNALGVENLRTLIEAMASLEVQARHRAGWYVLR